MEIVKRIIKLILAVLLIPLCLGLLKGFFTQFSFFSSFTAHKLFFIAGFGVYLIIQFLFFKPMRIYIFGHELTHAIGALLCGSKIKQFKVNKKKGSLVVSKSNFFISLAPYFFPLYTTIILLLYFVLNKFIDIAPYTRWFMFATGFTLSFHLALTLYAILEGQPDIRKTGILFSLVLIIIVNIIVIELILKLISPASISLRYFLNESVSVTGNIIFWISDLFRKIKRSIQ